MATNISNSVLDDEIDFIAAVAKAMATIYTATVDAYDIMVKEQNPDDLADGVDAAVAVRTRLAAGSGQYSQFSNMTQWLGIRASAAGVSGIDALLTLRKQRAPYSYDQYVHYPNGGTHLSARNIFYDTEIVLGDFVHGGTFSAVSSLTMSGSHSWVVLEVQTAGGFVSPWGLHVDVDYGDGSTATEPVSFVGSEAQYSTKNINTNPINGISEAGTYQVTLQTGTTGMVAGQWVLLVDNAYPVLLASGASAGATSVTVSPSQIGWYTCGDRITFGDINGVYETGHIAQHINYEYGTVTLATALANSYTTANSAFITRTTPAGDGFQESQPIASVTGTDLVFSGALQHSYGTGGYAHRLIRRVRDCHTDVGGTGGYEVHFQTKSDRTISQ